MAQKGPGDRLKVFGVLTDGAKHSVDEIAVLSGVNKMSVASRIRDLRTEKYGRYNIITAQEYIYQLLPGRYETIRERKIRLEREKNMTFAEAWDKEFDQCQ